ncbi:MAG: PIG-L family deacetylase [Terrimicrobiaceae bacterium]|nr:PIG-L family deacetylase [Terrimicrobiaceae bacterium]
MKLQSPNADVFIPDGAAMPGALSRVTHLGVGAHQDDLEFMAFHGIVECFHHKHGRWFGGVVCTDGGGSARTGPYAECSDEEMRRVRRDEQRAAAMTGRYAAMIQLGYPSSALKAKDDSRPAADLLEILRAARPEVVYTHNLADKHDTHIGVAAAVIEAVRRMPAAERPRSLLGCEVWRGLDWLEDSEKVVLDVSGHDNLAAALNGVFHSQIAGGKRYDLATAGRRAANATFLESHATDKASQVIFAMDLTPLLRDPMPDPVAYTLAAVDRFREDVGRRLRKRFA